MALSPPTPNLGLNVWSQGADTYNHSELANNFQKIDDHEHTPGKGKRIPTAALENGAVTGEKIASDAVTPDKIPNNSLTQDELAPDSVGQSELQANSVGTSELQNGSVTGQKLASGVIPLGVIVPWWRKDATVAVPDGWVIAQGQAWSDVVNDLGMTSGYLPDMRNRFVLGAAETGSGTGPGDAPGLGVTGGANTISLAHTHDSPGHTHTVPNHAHGIAVQASHTHRFYSHNYSNGQIANTFLTNANQREVGVPSSAGSRQVLYVPNLNINNQEGSNVDAPMGPDEYAGGVQHNHGGATAGSGNITTSSSSGGSTTSALGSTDLRPRYIGLLYIMRVKI